MLDNYGGHIKNHWLNIMQTSDLWHLIFLAWAVVTALWVASGRPEPARNVKRGNRERQQGEGFRRYLLAFNNPRIYIKRL